MNIEDLFNEYAGCYRVVDNCEDDGYGCKMCEADNKRMKEIIKEVEALVRKETLLFLLERMSELSVREPLPKHLTALDIHIFAKEQGITIK